MKSFNIPGKPSIEFKQQKPDARRFAVIPLRAIHDKRLTRGDYVNLITLCSYCSNNGFTFVAYSTMAKLRGCSSQNIGRGMKKLERLGYFKIVRKGYTGLRGALKRVIFDETLSINDVVAISNTPISITEYETDLIQQDEREQDMARRQKIINTVQDDKTPINFDEALLVVSDKIINDNDLLKLEQLITKGVTKSELLAAYQ
jgi:hypothetical protein